MRHQAPPPPYQQTKANGIIVSVAYHESVIRQLLPAGIEPVDDMVGGIHIYAADDGYGIAPYSTFYFYVYVKGFDSADGTKGRWMLQGAYGPEKRVSASLRQYFGFPVKAGESRREVNKGNIVSTGVREGQEVLRVVVTPKLETRAFARGTLNYPAQIESSGEIVVGQFPILGVFGEADPVSVEILTSADDPLTQLNPARILGAGTMEDMTFAFPKPASVEQVKAEAHLSQ